VLRVASAFNLLAALQCVCGLRSAVSFTRIFYQKQEGLSRYIEPFLLSLTSYLLSLTFYLLPFISYLLLLTSYFFSERTENRIGETHAIILLPL